MNKLFNTDALSSTKTRILSKSSTPKTLVPSTLSTNSLCTPRKSSVLFSRDTNPSPPIMTSSSLLTVNLLLLLIGVMITQSPLLKTRDPAVHAGLSLPSVVLKVSMLFKLVTSLVSLNNNLLIAQLKTPDATVVISPLPTNTLLLTVSKLKLLIPTLVLMANALTMLLKLFSVPLLSFKFKRNNPNNSLLLLTSTLSPFALKLTVLSSNSTLLVSSRVSAVKSSITASSLLVTTLTLGSLRTPGVLTGVSMDTSRLLSLMKPVLVSAVSSRSPFTLFTRLDLHIHSSNSYLLNPNKKAMPYY